MLSYEGDDLAGEIAREQVAAKLNLARGSVPGILPIVQEADEFLTAYPPGSDPEGDDRILGEQVLDQLSGYNRSQCRIPWGPHPGPFRELPFDEAREYE